ncbi:TlpA disulfide reductase family protein [Chitinophaga sp. 212800010-3]|uniref:TlpA disulfide reductase family protein n=1 Tax=unclassified Chitinophaga TaxID=2619133 RepID=UPI002DED8A71|nr:Thioredoxin domain-containing protein [Chitinophaga sp. 212800010-3]
MKNVLRIAIFLLLPACCFADPGFMIKGKVSGIISGYVAIKEMYQSPAGEPAPVLPPKVRIENGEFVFSGKVDHPVMVTLKVSTREFSIYLENTAYTVSGDLNTLTGASFRGSVLNDEFQQCLESHTAGPDYIKAHPDSEISAFLALFESAHSYSKSTAAYDQLGPNARKTWPGRELASVIEVFKKSAPGTVFPDLKLTGKNGKPFSIKNMAGKIVVLDFWASWCAPCRAYIPTLREHYEKYKGKGVEFISVSVDESKEKWQDALAELRMEWTQMLADGAFENGKGVKELLSINSIPHVIVVNKDGKIAASLDAYQKNELEPTLDKLTK